MKSVLNFFVVAAVLTLVACAPDKNGGNSQDVAVVPPPVDANHCIQGQVLTQYGCLNPGNCPPNYGLYNNQCVPTYVNNNNGYYTNGGYYSSSYYQNRNSYYGVNYYGGGYYGGYPTRYYGAGIGAGFYVGGGAQVGVPGMYYGY